MTANLTTVGIDAVEDVYCPARCESMHIRALINDAKKCWKKCSLIYPYGIQKVQLASKSCYDFVVQYKNVWEQMQDVPPSLESSGVTETAQTGTDSSLLGGLVFVPYSQL